MLKKCALVIWLVSAANLQADDIYKVIDENGRVQFTQFPPYKDAEELKLKNNTKGSTSNKKNNNSNA